MRGYLEVFFRQALLSLGVSDPRCHVALHDVLQNLLKMMMQKSKFKILDKP